MTPERTKYLQSISFAERVCRHCINVCKDKLKSEKRYLSEHKVKPFLSGNDITKVKKRIRVYKRKLTYFKRELRIGTNHEVL